MIEVVVRYLAEISIDYVWQRFIQEVIVLNFFIGIGINLRTAVIVITGYVAGITVDRVLQRRLCPQAEFTEAEVLVFVINA